MRDKVVYPYTINAEDSGDISDICFLSEEPCSGVGHSGLFSSRSDRPHCDFNQWLSNSGVNFATWESKQETDGQQYVITTNPKTVLHVVYFNNYYLDLTQANDDEQVIARSIVRGQKLDQPVNIHAYEFRDLKNNEKFSDQHLSIEPMRDDQDQLRIDYMYCLMENGQMSFKRMTQTDFWADGWALPKELNARQLIKFVNIFGEADQKDFTSLFSARRYLTIQSGSIDAVEPIKHLSYVINHVCPGTPTQRYVIRSPQDFREYRQRMHCAQKIFDYMSPSQMFFSQFRQCFFSKEGSTVRPSDYEHLLSYDSLSRRMSISIHHDKRTWKIAKVSQDWLGVNELKPIDSKNQILTDIHKTVLKESLVARIGERSYQVLISAVGRLIDTIGVYGDLYIHEYSDIYSFIRVFVGKTNARQCITEIINHKDQDKITINHGTMSDHLDPRSDLLMTRRVRKFRWFMPCRINPWKALEEALHYPSRHSTLEISIQSFKRYHFYWWATLGVCLAASLCWEVAASVNEWQMTTGVFQNMYLWQLGLIATFGLILLLVIKRQYDTRKITWSHFEQQPISCKELANNVSPKMASQFHGQRGLTQQHKV